MNKKLFLFPFIFLLFCSSVLLSQSTIRGYVTDENNLPVPGVNVLIKGTVTGAITNSEGNYSIDVPNPSSDILVFSFIGYNTEEIGIGGKTVVNVSLIPALEELDEVVVVGYGTQKKKDLTGSIVTVNANQLKDMPVTSLTQAITGRMAGVQITTTEGSPDAEVKIRVRGGGSVTQDNSPLYIIDGFPADNINDVAPGNIESITVLKDASSASIYGSRGANGVVIITTKSGEKGKVAVHYNAYYGIKQLPENNKLDVLNSYEYVLYQYERSRGSFQDRNRFQDIYGNFEDLDSLYGNVASSDWQEEIFGRDAKSVQHNITITGGQENTNYNLSYTFDDVDGIMIESGFKRHNVNFKFQNQTTKRLKVDFNARFSDTRATGAGTSDPGTTTTNLLRNAIIYRPVAGLNTAEEDPELDFDEDEYYTVSSLSNPVQLAHDDYRFRKSISFTLNGGLTLNLSKNFDYKAEIGYSKKDIQNERFYGLTTYTARRYGDMPVVSVEDDITDEFRLTNTLNFHKIFLDKHNLSVLAGVEAIITDIKEYYQETHGYPADISRELALGMLNQGSDPQIPISYVWKEKLFSYFGRALYNYNEKYLATFTLRADGSSKFWKGNHWGLFPSGSVGWRVSQEEFMKNIEMISSMKIRGSIGAAGNEKIDNLLFLRRFDSGETKFYYLNDQAVPYLYSPVLANPGLKWESTISRNIGIDLGILQNKMNFTIDYYNNTTKDLLIDKMLDGTLGYDSQMQNIGQTTNYGFEIAVDAYIIEKKDFQWSANFNISFNHSRIDKLYAGENLKTYSSGWNNDIGSDYMIKVGDPVGLIYGFVSDGFYSVDDFEIDPGTGEFLTDAGGDYILKPGIANNGQLLNASVTPGTIKFKNLADNVDNDGDSNPDPNVITNEDDRTIIGNTNPKHFGGLNTSFKYKNIDLSIFLNWVYGNDVYNANKIEFTSGYRPYTNILDEMNSSKRWMTVNNEGTVVTNPAELRELNTDATIWKPMTGNYLLYSWAIEDGSFLRISNITLGYSLPVNLLNHVFIKNFRIYGTVNNLYTFTKYSGYDPEVDTRRSTPLTPGVDYSAYPRSRMYLIGVNLTF